MKKIFYGWWIVIAAMLVFAVITPAAVALATKFLLPVTMELKASRTEFTLSQAIVQGMGIFLSPIISRMYEVFKFKYLHVAGIVMFAASLFMYALAENMVHFYLISILVGISFLLTTFIPLTIIISNWFKDKRGLATSIAMTGIGVGGFILSPLLTLWIDTYTWRGAYMIYAGLVLVILLPISLFVLIDKPEKLGLKAYEMKQLDSVKTEHSKQVSFNFSFKHSKTKPFFILLLVGMVSNGIVNSGALGQYPPAFEETYTSLFAATIISIYSIVGILGKLILGAVNDKFGILVSIYYGCGLIILTSLSALYANHVPVAYLLALLFGLGNAIGSVLPPLLTTTFFSGADFAKAYGVISSALQLGMTTGSLFIAYVFDQTGAYTSGWYILLALSFVTLITWILAYKTGYKHSQTTV